MGNKGSSGGGGGGGGGGSILDTRIINKLNHMVDEVEKLPQYFDKIKDIEKAIGDIHIDKYIKNAIDTAVSKSEGAIQDTSKGIGKWIKDNIHVLIDPVTGALKDIKDIPNFVKDEILKGTSEITSFVKNTEKEVKKALKSLEAAGLKFGKDLKKKLFSVINEIKKQECWLLKQIRKALKTLKNQFHKINQLFGDWWHFFLNILLKFLNKYLKRIDYFYFFYTFIRAWIGLTIVFALYGCLSIWSVFGKYSSPVRYVIFYSILYYWYTLGFFTLSLHIDPATFVSEFIEFFRDFFKNLKNIWKQFVDLVNWLYFIIVSFLFGILVSLIILLCTIVTPVLFNLLGEDNQIYVRNIIFYVIMYYLYSNNYFSIDVSKDPIKYVKDLWDDMCHPKRFFESMGEKAWEWFNIMISVCLFVIYWILLICIFMIYDNFNIFDIFGDNYSWYVENGVICGILLLLYLNGIFSPTQNAKELYTLFTTLSWKEIVNFSTNYFLWLYFIVVSFIFAVVVSTVIIIIALVSPFFDILGSDNNIYVRNAFFYIVLIIIYSLGYMTYTFPSGSDVWTAIRSFILV